jgi:hypothetical protein
MLADPNLASLGTRVEALRAAWSDAEKKAPALVQSILEEIKARRRDHRAEAAL